MKPLTSLVLLLTLSSASAWAQEPKPSAAPAPKAPTPAPAPKETSGEDATAPKETSPDAAAERAQVPDEPAAAEETDPEETPSSPVEAKPEEQPAVQEEPAPPPPTYEDDYAGVQSASTEDLVLEKKPSPFMLGLLWDTILPLGKTSDFAGKFSARGFSIDGRYSGFGNLGLGVTLAWHILDEKTRTTTTWESATVTGTQVREISSSPFTFKVSYALRDNKGYIPYLGVGVGAARVLRRIDMGISRVTDESWHFALVPELGVEVPYQSISLLASTRFNYFAKGDGAPAQTYMNFSVGIGFE